MKLFKQILILFSICLLSEFISKLLPFSFPSNVISMIVLLLLLISKVIRTESIRDISEFLLQNMAFFFIPATVAIIDEYDYLKDKILILLFISLFSLIITFIVTAFTVTLTTKLMNRKKRHLND